MVTLASKEESSTPLPSLATTDHLTHSPVQLHPPEGGYPPSYPQHHVSLHTNENPAAGRQDALKALPSDSCSSSALGSALRIQTNLLPRSTPNAVVGVGGSNHSLLDSSRSKQSSLHSPSASNLPVRRPSKKSSTLSTTSYSIGSLTPPSVISSPALNSMVDITPLPSPIVLSGAWDMMAPTALPDPPPSDLSPPDSVLVAANGEPISSVLAAQHKRKSYGALDPNHIGAHSPLSSHLSQNLGNHHRNRDVSDYVPETMQVRKPRHITVSESGSLRTTEVSLPSTEPVMKREQYLAVQRGLASPVVVPPTPPASNSGRDSDSGKLALDPTTKRPQAVSPREIFEAEDVCDHQRKTWTGLCELGTGTFSRVVLATSQEEDQQSPVGGLKCDLTSLVAVKIVEHGPAGGASQERVEVSLKREVEILKSIHHPSLVHLKAFSCEPTRALLVLTYCPGGDMYDVASERHQVLVPSLIQRIFAELVAATLYLHDHLIVHRDIKLENVLLNIPSDQLSARPDWRTYPHSVVTLTDMGLSRRIDPADPKLHTRCGSEDYASPELLMGQAYDGRQTDAWALGVLLYAIMEGRLPFDPLPGASETQKMRGRTIHRIARCDWRWCKYADDEGEPGDFGELEGARAVVEGLLRRASRRVDLKKVAAEMWVRDGIQVEGGLRFEEFHEAVGGRGD